MRAAALAITLFLLASLAGCEKKKVVDVEAPGIDVEVDEDGETRIETDD